ncbi:MAG: O-antigen ligase family protein [Candidatus Taylorbacteria bacterium]|nr:O-antigen ligase family protein [Candidatus Taylorbacteria bacterium]
MFTFLGLLAVLLPFSMLPVRSVPEIIWWLVFSVMFICAQCLVKSEKVLENLSKIFVILTAGFGVASIYNFTRVGLTAYMRLDGIIGTHNIYGGFLIIPFFLSIYLIVKEEKRWQKYIWLLSGAIIFSSIILTFSRGTWVSIVVAIIVGVGVLLKIPRHSTQPRGIGFAHGTPFFKGGFLFGIPWDKARSLRGLTLLIFIIFTVLMTGGIWLAAKHSTIANNSTQITKTAVFSNEDGESNAFTARLHYFSDALQTYTHSPIVGFGAGNYAYALRMYKIDPNYGSFADPHNWLLKMLVEDGLIVTIIFVGFIISLFWQMRQLIVKRKEIPWLAVAVFTGLIGGTIHGLMDFDWSINLLLLVFFVFAGALYGYLLNTQELDVEDQGGEINGNPGIQYFPKWTQYILVALVLISAVISIQLFRADLARAKGDVYLSQLNDTDSAINSYFESVLLNKYEPATWYDLWRAYFIRKNYRVAIDSINKTIALFPQSGMYYTALAQTEEAMGDFTNYRETLLKAIKYFPASDLTSQVNLVNFDFKQKKYDEALALIDQVLPIYTHYQSVLWFSSDPNSEMISKNLVILNDIKNRIRKIQN